MNYLDTNVVIHCLKGREPAASKFLASKPSQLAIPSVVAYELEYGTLKALKTERRQVLARMLGNIEEIPFDRDAAMVSARIRVDLEKRGLMISPMDLLIAGTTLSRGATLVTNNFREFSRVKGLRLDDWSAQ